MPTTVKLLIPGKSGEYVKVFRQFRKWGYLPRTIGKALADDGRSQILAMNVNIEPEDLQLKPGLLHRILGGLEYKIIEPAGYEEIDDQVSSTPSNKPTHSPEFDIVLEEGHEPTLSREDDDLGDIFASYKGRRDKF